MLRNAKKLLVLPFIGSLLLLFIVGELRVFAQDDLTPTPTPTQAPDANNDKLKSLQDEINDYQSKITDLRGQEKTLSNTIAVMDDKIELSKRQISITEARIELLNAEIEKTNNKIMSLNGSLTDMTKLLISRIVATYEQGNSQTLDSFLASSNVADYLAKTNYVKAVQAHDKELIYSTEQAKNDYATLKTVREDQKKQIEDLKTSLVKQNDDLDQAKKDKQSLLANTKDNEANYQQKLQTALAEQAAISAIGQGGGNAAAVGPVQVGDTVGYVISGPSACSTGSHLHFEVHNGGGTVDPAGYLSSHSVTWDNSPDGSFSFSGSWQWPLSDPISIYQGYGMTTWARTGYYGGGPHTGIDMYSSASSAVHAVKSGTLYRGGIKCGGGTLLFAKVVQDDGTEAYYLHTIP